MIYEYPYYIEEIRESQCEPDSTSGKQRKERVEKQSRANQPEARGEEESQYESACTSGK
jgi:hypothetical protein